MGKSISNIWKRLAPDPPKKAESRKKWSVSPVDLLDVTVAFPQCYESVFNASSVRPVAPVDLAGVPVSFIDLPATEHPEICVFHLEDTLIHHAAGLVQVGERFMYQSSWYQKDLVRAKYPSSPKETQVTDLIGHAVSLTSEFANRNYGHFMLDVIGRSAVLAKKWGNQWQDHFDHIIVPGPQAKWKERLLKRFGIALDKCKWIEKKASFRCEQLTLTSFPGYRRYYASWLCQYLRKHGMGSDSGAKAGDRRLYIPRKDTTRKITNNQELEKLLMGYGYEMYYPENAISPIDDFSMAQSVIGAHGSGLTDVLFMPEGGHVLELLPSDHQHPYFYSIGKALDLDYRILLCASEGEREERGFQPSPYDFTVDLEQVEKHLNHVL